MSNDDLVRRARERAETPPVDPEWGYRVQLAPGEWFEGRYRGETDDPDNLDNDGNPRRIFLFWDSIDGRRCWSRTYTALAREFDRARPTKGYTIVVFRGSDYASGKGNPGQSYGVEIEPNSDPLPDDDKNGDGIPF